MTEACQLYLISPPEIDDLAAFLSSLTEALDAGRAEQSIACFQLRLKNIKGNAASDEDILRISEKLQPILQSHDVVFLLNDRPDLAQKIGADGVHLGQTDMPLKEARAMLGDDASIGVTCHASTHLGLVAGEAGADYVAFGAFFETETKAASSRAEPDILEWWHFATTVPSVAIGGITPQNCGPLVKAGADFLAVSGAVWMHPQGPAEAVIAFQRAIIQA